VLIKTLLYYLHIQIMYLDKTSAMKLNGFDKNITVLFSDNLLQMMQITFIYM
jgi:hypothetical protein